MIFDRPSAVTDFTPYQAIAATLLDKRQQLWCEPVIGRCRVAARPVNGRPPR
jgi:hypothetical protein